MRVSVLCAAFVLLAMTTAALGAAPMDALSFLVGEWSSPSAVQAPSGEAEFTFALQDHVMLRKSYAEYPSTAGKSAFRHDDLMVIYAVPAGDIRADYYDSEGHTIRYRVQIPESHRAVFLSDSAQDQPRFRLSYNLEPTGVLKGTFEIAQANTPEAFKPYLQWEGRREGKEGE